MSFHNSKLNWNKSFFMKSDELVSLHRNDIRVGLAPYELQGGYPQMQASLKVPLI